MIQAEQLHARILEELDMTREIEDEELTELIYRVLQEASSEEYLSLSRKTELGKELFNAFRKLDLLQEFLEDEGITEIMINGTRSIFFERDGRIHKSDKRFLSKEKLEDVIQQIVASSNRLVNEASPIVDARLADGSRVNVVLEPVAVNGPIVTIRKFGKDAITMDQLIAWNSISKEISDFLAALVAAGYNIFISGGTGSGKTTFLNALSQYIPKDERIITIEDNAELKLQDIPNLVSLEARNPNVEGTGAVTIRDLIKSALRMRPDRIIVGEVRGAEAIDMLQALNTGHDGSLSTGHANSTADMLARLETMVLMGMKKKERRQGKSRGIGGRYMRLRTIRNSRWQDMTKKELAMITIKSGAVTLVTAWLYYRSFWMLLPLLPVWAWHFKMMAEEVARKKDQEFLLQFKEAIQAMASALNTGYSVENALLEAQKELRLLYPEDARISREFLVMARQLRLHVPMEQILEEFAGRSGQEDVENFVAVFAAARKSGGDMISIIRNTANQIGDKIDVKREIDTVLAAKKYEFRVMAAIPYAIIGYMSLSFPEFMDSLYGNIMGIGVMSACLTMYLGAYYLGARIIRIEV